MTEIPYLLFQLNGSFYAIDIEFVHEIVELPALNYTAEMPPHLAGLFNLHGEIVEILDLGVCLNYSPHPYSSKDFVIILKGPSFFLGFIVSRIIDIQHISNDAIFSAHSSHLGENQEEASPPLLSKAVAKHEEQIIFILDPYLLIKKIAILEQSFPYEKFSREQKRDFHTDKHDELLFSLRAQNLMRRPFKEIEEIASLIPLIVIKLEEEYFGIDPATIKEFRFLGEFTPLFHLSPQIIGFMNLRGNILTLIDICFILKKENLTVTASSQILIINLDNMWIGLVVDSVVDIIYLKSTEFRPIPIEIEGTFLQEYTLYTVLYGKNILGVLDVDKILEFITK